jgi:hypothetical protein
MLRRILCNRPLIVSSCVALIGFWLNYAAPFADAQIAPPAAGDYGGVGPYTVAIDTFANPVYPTANGVALNVSLYHPIGAVNSSLPTIFFAHGFTNPVGNAQSYDNLLTNLASQGYNVVFSPFEGGSNTYSNNPRRLDELTSGFDAAVNLYSLNTAQIGFAGHSKGAGFLPSVIQHEMMGVTNQNGAAGHNWGATSAFMFAMSPGFADGLPATQSIALPANLTLVEQVYNDDTVWADPRNAIDVFNNSTVPDSQKDFITVFSDNHGITPQLANHFLPTNLTVSEGLQDWAVFRHLDALAAFTFTGDPNAKNIALGNGSVAETTDGQWSDGTAVTPLSASDFPNPDVFFAGNYVSDWDNPMNPRRSFVLASPGSVPEPTSASLLVAGLGFLFLQCRRNKSHLN